MKNIAIRLPFRDHGIPTMIINPELKFFDIFAMMSFLSTRIYTDIKEQIEA